MGGILSAEVALLVPYSPTSREPFRHRILGTINFDTPFLGMHPGVVVSGIGSLFRPAPDPPGTQPVLVDGVNTPLRQTTTPTTSSSVNTRGIPSSAGPQGSYFDSTSTMPALTSTASGSIDADSVLSPFASPPSDPNYNPPFPNDVRIPIRTGWDNALHFMIKHSDGLTKATKSYVTSHLEFGGCLADYKGLRNRYARIRNLEDVDEFSQDQYQGGKQKRRVRFVNYYTASTGRIKVLKAPETEHLVRRGRSPRPVEMEMHDMSLSAHTALSTSRTRSPSRSPRISVEEHRDGKIVPQPLQDLDESLQTSQYGLLDRDVASSETSGEMDTIDPSPVDDSEPSNIQGDKKHSTPSMPENPPPDPPNNLPNRSPTDTSQPSPPPPTQTSSLPPIPPLPTSPPPFDPTGYKDKDTFKLAEKEHARTLKTYQRALKDRDTAIKDRRKLLEKREKKARQDREKQLKADEKQRLKDEKEDSKRRATLNPEPKPPPISKAEKADRAVLSKPPPTEKKKKDKKFCVLPPKIDGKRDACWVRVYMEGVDEVGAHCGLFFVGAQYETLVGDVGARIEDW
ncbi:MAG: hypothetical protein M1830_005830, partial [Pleopsidium flavum]